ncbi:hypothetical protein [uncultured Umboniibacter sp.]|uniref:hypothetical protein n=1 Tax=uncultured Umboniibacter sp. TaxID=1798917 RepID=UPI002614C721|nr:hypothetical protein [uncultured Umboniibacter sp.]
MSVFASLDDLSISSVAITLSLFMMIVGAYFLYNRHRLTRDLPSIFNGSRLFLNERFLNTPKKHAIQIAGRFDQVFKLTSGELAVVDNKQTERTRYYPSDVAQLSSYAEILRSRGYRVLTTGFLRCENQRGEVTIVEVPLKDHQGVAKLVEKYHYLRTHRELVNCRCGRHLT